MCQKDEVRLRGLVYAQRIHVDLQPLAPDSNGGASEPRDALE